MPHKLYISHVQSKVQVTDGLIVYTPCSENEGAAAEGRRLIFFIFILVHLWPALLIVHGSCKTNVWPIYCLCVTYKWYV